MHWILRLLTFILLLPMAMSAQAQSTPFAHWVHFTIDNDSFLFSETDWYYTSGIYASYRKVIDKDNALIRPFATKECKVIRRLGLAHQIYTPRLFNVPLVDLYDRPHAALLQFDYGLSFAQHHQLLDLQVSLGWMGPALGTGSMLTWFHDLLGYRTPRGWQYEIGNAPIIQTKVSWHKALFTHRLIDLTLTTRGELGTIQVNGAVGPELRIGRFLPIHHSLLFNQHTEPNGSKGLSEIFLIAGGDMAYIPYNATIQGPSLGRESPHTETPANWVANGHLGLGVGGNRMDALVMINFRSPTTTEAQDHKFISIKLNYRL